MKARLKLEQLSDEELARRCSRRPVDQDAWDEFYLRFHRLIRKSAMRALTGPTGELDDVVQVAEVRVFQALPRFRPEVAHLATYISKVVFNAVKDYFRHGRAQRRNTVSLDADLVHARALVSEDPELCDRAVSDILSLLKDPRKIQIVTDLIEGITVKEICATSDATPYEVYGARLWLRRVLGDITGEKKRPARSQVQK